jgi:hypothetical protein
MTDTAAGTVSVLSATGGTIFGKAVTANTPTTLITGLANPVGITFDSAGNLYVASNQEVSVLPQAGGTIFGQPVTADQLATVATGFSFPVFLAFDSAGNLYVSDYDASTVSVVPVQSGTLFGQTVNANIPNTLLSGLQNPAGVSVDSAGNLYIAEENNTAVLPASTGVLDGVPVTAGTLTNLTTGGLAEFGTAIYGGSLYVADQGNSSVDEVGAPTATITGVTIGGSVEVPIVEVTGTGFSINPPTVVPGCGGTGEDYPYGNLFLGDSTGGWGAGTPGDCIGLTTEVLTPTEVEFTLGSFYSGNFTLSPGDQYSLWVDGLQYSGTVAYSPSTTLSVSSPTVDGVETVPASAVPASSVSSSTSAGDAASAPLSSIPLDSIGLGSAPLDSIPLDSIPLDSIAAPAAGAPSGLAAAANVLSRSLLSEIGITYPQGCSGTSCTGWQGVLAGSQYAGVPLESVTLADVLKDTMTGANGQASPATNFASVDLGSVDLASSPLDSIPLDSIALGSVPLSSVRLATAASNNPADVLTAWCNDLAGISANFACQNFGIDPSSGSTDVTLLTLTLAGVPLDSIPLDSIPLDSIPLDSIPLDSIPLDSINLATNPLDSIPLDSIDLASNPLDSIPLDSIPAPQLALLLSCSPVPTCAGAGATVGQAATAGYVQSGATIGDIINGDNTSAGGYPSLTLADILKGDNTSATGYPDLTLEDLVLMTTPPASYPWQAVTLPDLPLAADETAGGAVVYTATLTVTSTGIVQASVSLPATFSYVVGSSTLDGAPVPDPVQTGCPGTGGQTSCTVGWTFPSLGVGAHTLTFEANAGIGLGPAAATLSTSVAGDPAPLATASVDVVDGEEPAVSAPGTAPTLVTGTPPATGGDLNIGYITAPGDVNDWAVTVPAGSPELSIALTNLPATYDLELFGPGAQQLSGTPSQDLSGVSDTLPSIVAGTTTEATPGSQDLPVTPPAGDQLIALSNNPDSQDQDIQTPPLAPGTYIVQVSGYNGAFSSQPYLLRANLLGGPTSPSCPGLGSSDPAIPYLNSLSAPASTPDIPGGVNTLFLVDTQRLTAAFPSDEGTIMSNLQAVASDSAAGVDGAVIPVDAYPDVQAAYATWNENPCSVDAANGVVAAIAAVVDQIKEAHPTVQNLVIVGADDQIPLARIADGTTESNERDYGASAAVGQDNVESDALSLGYYFSDDPYAASQPLGVGSATLYTPQLAVGRLVESAPEIENALTRFVSSDGNLDATASLTTGYSFLTSGAKAVSANLGADGLTASTLISETWTESDLDAALAGTGTPSGQTEAPGVDSINAHFDYSRALPASNNASGTSTNLFTTNDVRNAISSYGGRLLFSMGCHAGLDVDDAEVDASVEATASIDDWAKTFADAGALWVANTGYGYADTDTIAYSAKLMVDFAANLNGTLTIGEALAQAKQQYAAGDAILSPYDLKALMESTLYGLPMYNLNSSAGTPPGVPGGPTTTPVSFSGGPAASTGLTGALVSLDPSVVSVGTSSGTYYQATGTAAYSDGTQTTEYRPIEPLVAVPVTETDLVPHGALVTGLTSTDYPGFTPAYSMPAVGSADDSPPAIGEVAFPGTLQRVSTYGAFTQTGTTEGAQLDLVAGQYFPSSSAPGTGTQRLFTSMSAEVLYQSPGNSLINDYAPATIGSSSALNVGGAYDFAVTVTPSSASDPVVGVVVLYTDASSPGQWAAIDLTSADGLNWSGTGAVTPSGKAQYLVEAVDQAGNVAVSNNEGVDFNSVAPTTTSLSSSANPSVDSVPVTFTATVASTAAGQTGPTGNVEFFDGGAPIAACGGAAGEIVSDGQATCAVTNSSPGLHQVTATYGGDSNFASSTTSGPLTQTVDEPQTISFSGPSVAGTGTSTPLSAVGGASGNLVVFSVDATSGAGVCNVSGPGGATLNYTAAGNCVIDANQVGSGYYLAAPQAQWSVTVIEPFGFTSPATLTVPAGTAFNFPVSATGSPAPTSISESGSLPSGMTFTAGLGGTATLSGTTAVAAGVYDFTFLATGPTGTTTQAFTLTVTAPPAFSSATSTTFTGGQPASFTVMAPGTPTPTFSESGALPSGLSFVDNGNGTATLTGTATLGHNLTTGTFDLTFTAANSVATSTQEFTLTVTSGSLLITSAASTTFTSGTAGTFAITATGMPTPTLSESGALPSGVTFKAGAAGTATLAGTLAASAKGFYPIALTATSKVGKTSQAFALVVDKLPSITSSAAVTETAGAAFSFAVAATGYPAPALSAVLPAGATGVSFSANANGTATLAGTAAVRVGTYTVNVSAANTAGTATQVITLTVKAAGPTETVPIFSSAPGAIATAGSALAFTVTTVGSPTAYATNLSHSGALPAGVSFANKGKGTATLTGTPTAASGGTYEVTFKATNAAGTATQSFTLTVEATPRVTSGASSTATVGVPFSFTVKTTGFPPPALSESGTLPAGLSFVDNGNGTATLSGAPDAGAGGTYTFTVSATSSAGITNQTFTLTVRQPPLVANACTASTTTGATFACTFTATGYPVPTVAHTGTVAGLSWTTGSGTVTLSGTPTAAGTYPLTVTATNNSGKAVETFTLTVT